MENLCKTPTSTSGRTKSEKGRLTFSFAFWPILLVLLSLLVVGSAIVFTPSQPVNAAGDPPVVDGLYFGDGDDAKYGLYSVSENGSELYLYYDAQNTRLYAAMVVTQTLNDTVCSSEAAYTASAGWNKNKARSCSALTNSEFASFTFECAPGSPNSWAWQQGFGCAENTTDPDSAWKSDENCPASLGVWPPSIDASTSWVYNANTYQDEYPYSTPWPPTAPPEAVPPWDMYAGGIDPGHWTSPYFISPTNAVSEVLGYPTFSTYDQISPANGYSTEDGWEWSMVYEWSIDLGPDGTDCGNDRVYLVTGESHHSPSKNDVEDDWFPEDPDPLADWGDLPDSYGTYDASGGPYHYLTVNGPYLGETVQAEPDGVPTDDALGDGPEEDGIYWDPTQAWRPGTTVQIEATVVTSDSNSFGRLVGWFDWDNSGTFGAGEMIDWGELVSGTHTFDVTVPSTATLEGYIYMRFRLYEPETIPTTISATGAATGGEVEDYYHSWNPLAVDLVSFTAQTQDHAVLLEWATATELDTIGFYLYRAESPTGRRIQLNSELIASHAPHSLSGALYTHPDDTAVPGITYYYWLEVVNFSGSGRTYGPISATAPVSGPDTPRSHRVYLPFVGK